MKTYCNDQYIDISFDPTVDANPVDRYTIGPIGTTVLTEWDDDHSDDDAIYVTSTGSDADPGTWDEPMLTIAAAILACDSDRSKVLVYSSTGCVFYEDYADIVDDYCTGVYAHPDSAEVSIVVIDATTYAEFLAIETSGGFVHVSGASGNDTTGDGSYETPYATIAKAVSETGVGKEKICVIDSETYTEPGIEFTGNFQQLWAYPGETPTFEVTKNNDLLNADPAENVASVEFAAGVSDLYSCVMSNGNTVIAYRDTADGNAGKFVIYSNAGTLVAGPTEFESGATSEISCAVFSDDNFVIAYSDDDDGQKGKFVIIDSTGTSILYGPTEFEAGATAYTACGVFSDDKFVITYQDSDDGAKGKFVVYTAAGVAAVAITEFHAASTSFIAMGIMSDDNFVVAYRDAGDGTKGKFVVYTSAGVAAVAETEFEAGITAYISCAVLSDDRFVIAYQDTTDGSKGKMVVYTSAGVLETGPTEFEAGDTKHTSCGVFSDDSFIISYMDDDDGNKGKFVIYDSEYAQIVAITIFDAGSVINNSTHILSDDNISFSYRVGAAGGLLIYYPPAYDMILVSTDAVIHGFYLTQAEENFCDNLIHGDASTLDISYCDIYNAVNGSGQDAWAIYTDDEIDVRYSRLSSNDAGIYAATSTGVVKWNEIRDNVVGYALHIDGAGSGIEVEHNTIYGNYGGLRLENNDGDESIKNNIIHAHSSYAINADTAITTTYSDITGTTNNVTRTSCITSNPLFRDGGELDPDDTDLHLMDELLGDPDDSPAKNLADDSDPDRSAGCYDTVYIGEGETWTTVRVEKPLAVPVEVEPVGDSRNVSVNGTISTGVDGYYERLKLKWDSMINSEAAYIDAIYECMEPRIRIYPDPITYPNEYDEHYVVYNKYNYSPKKNYRLSRTGVDDMTLTVDRKKV